MAESTGILLLNAEDNDESHLTITEEGSNSFSITTGAALHGTYGYHFAFSGDSGENLCYVYKSFTAGADIYARCYFEIPSDYDAAVSAQITIFGLNYSSSGGSIAVKPYMIKQSDDVIRIFRLYYYLNSGMTYYTLRPYVEITRDTAHYMEVRYKAGNGDGIVSLWLDGTQLVNLTGLTNDNHQAGYIVMGNNSAAVPTAGSYFDMDDIKIDSSPIGAYSDAGGGNSYYYQQQQM